MSANNAVSSDFEVDGIGYTIVSLPDLTCEITSYNTRTGDIVIPSTVTYKNKQLSVVSIGKNVFYGSSITGVTIENGVTSIGESAFRECSELTSVKLPNSLTRIGALAFYDCSNLNDVVFPESLTSIATCAFSKCSSLTITKLPSSLTFIGKEAFYKCNIESISIPKSVEKILGKAFYHTGLHKLVLEDGNEDLYLEADDTTLNGYGDGAFKGYGIESLYMGRNLSYETFASAGYAPFRYLHWLKELTIGKFVTKIGSKLFSNSEKIEVITCLASTPPVLAKDIFTNEQYLNSAAKSLAV